MKAGCGFVSEERPPNVMYQHVGTLNTRLQPKKKCADEAQDKNHAERNCMGAGTEHTPTGFSKCTFQGEEVKQSNNIIEGAAHH